MATATGTYTDASTQDVTAAAQDTGEGRFSVKVPGVFENVDDILNMPVVVNGDATVRVRDIAEVRKTFKDPTGFARISGKRAIALEVSKRTGENIIETIGKVRAVVAEETANWPEDLRKAVTVSFSQDKSDSIRNILQDLQNNVLSAILLVMIVIVAFLGLRTAGLVGVSIPGSFLTGILVIAILGLTLNIVVLFRPTKGSGADTKQIENGRRIFMNGIPAARVQACASCHGANAAGAGIFPRLAGQHAEYLVKQLSVFKSELRSDKNATLMHTVSSGMSFEQMQAVAAYLASR